MKKINRFIKYILFQLPQKIKIKLLSDCKNLKGKANLIQPVLISGKGKINFKNNINFGIKRSPFFYNSYSYIEARGKNSLIEIRNNVSINNNFVLISQNSIIIDDNTLIGFNFEAIDSDFHSLEASKRLTDKGISLPIYIGKNVFIGNNVKILKGVNIGENSVIGNSSVVTKDVPENCIYAGIPAKFIKEL